MLPASEVRAPVTMDWHRFSLDVKHVLKEARHLRSKNGRAHKYDLVILFARIWFLKAEIFGKRSSTPLTTSVEDFIKALLKGSGFLQKSFPRPLERTEDQILKLIEEVPGQVESLYQSSDAEELVGNRVRDLLYKFLVQVMLLKAEGLLLDILQNEANLMHQIGTLREGLILIIQSDINQPRENTENEKLILAEFEGVAIGVISLCNSCSTDRITEEVKNMEFQLSDLLVKVQLLKAKLVELYLQIPRINFPNTLGLCSIKFLLQNLRQLLTREHDSLACATHHIKAMCRDLEFIISTLENAFDKGFEHEELSHINTRLVDVAYQVEYVIDSMVLQNDAVWQELLWLHHLLEEITHIKMQVTVFSRKRAYDVGVRNVGLPLLSRVTTPSIMENMVGFEDEKQLIIDELIRGSWRQNIVPIVGMPGIGKTTLAYNVFCSPVVKSHFHVRAWCCVSEAYRKENLLGDILNQIRGRGYNILAMSDEDLSEQLWRHLKGKRYLIVLDDMWSSEAWDDLQSILPEDLLGSRILITTRLTKVVSKFSDLHPFFLRLLSDQESWELLKMRIFGEEKCPPVLVEVGQQISRGCKGLPLAIVGVAGLLKHQSLDRWHQIADNLSLSIDNFLETQHHFAELNYQSLPHYLKACFLYFGAFPKDEDILVQRLLWLWIAEGFIHKRESNSLSLEDLAEAYLMELIDRGLVIAAKRSSYGKVKTCRVHDFVYHFCLSKLKEANFFHLTSSYDDAPDASFDFLDHGHGPHNELGNPWSFINFQEYRLCVCSNQEQFLISTPSGPYARSLLFFAITDTETYPGFPYDVSFISNNFKLVRVLDLENIYISSSLKNGIDLLVHLRYLAVSGDIDSLPSSLSNLQNLEVLVVKSSMRIVVLPDTLWSMTKLRHVHVTNLAVFTLQNDKDGSDSILDSLVTLSLPFFSNGKVMNNTIMRFPNLQNLRCIFLQSRDAFMSICLESLSQLESLKISYYGKAFSSGELSLPSSLKMLSLSNFRMPWDHISSIGRLPNLEVLKLTSKAFEGPIWEMAEGEFLQLQYLKLDSLNIVQWDACSDHLPNLQHLVLRNCKQLEEVPLDFVGIPTLQKIEVHQCGISAERSVRQIVEDASELGFDLLMIN